MKTVLPALLSLLAAPCAAQQIIEYHDQIEIGHESLITSLSANNYRPISITCYGSGGGDLFGAVWEQKTGPAFVEFHDKTEFEYELLLPIYANLGFSLSLVAACGPRSDPRFMGVLEQDNIAPWIRHDLTAAQLISEMDDARGQGFLPVCVDAYGSSNDPRFVVSFKPNTADVDWAYTISDGAAEFQAHATAMNSTWMRLHRVGLSAGDWSVGVWHDDSYGLHGVRHDRTGPEFAADLTSFENGGYFPLETKGAGSGSSRRFAAAWCEYRSPLPKVWNVTGTSHPGLQAFDTWAQGYMQANDVRGAQLAIVKDCRLVHVRGYTLAERDYPITQPTDVFRIASTSKPLTSIAIHQLLDSPALDKDDTMVSRLQPNSVLSPLTNLITVEQLLNHTSGYTTPNFDPMFYDSVIAQAMNGFPVSKNDIFRWMNGSYLPNAIPGTLYSYENYNYTLLGMILEDHYQLPYSSIMQAYVFGPLGITRAHIGASLVQNTAANEVRYHWNPTTLLGSVMTPARQIVPQHYGGANIRNMDAHGGWVMAAADYAKVLASFTGPYNPLLGADTVNDMWSNTPISGWSRLRGWRRQIAGNGSTLYFHGGLLRGSGSEIAVSDDGYAYVFFTNRHIGVNVVGTLSNLADGVLRWPEHDLFPSVGLPGKRYHRGSITPEGQGCRGSYGVPNHTVSGTPDIGEALTFELTSAVPSVPVVCMLGVAPAFLDLSGIGMPSCSLYVDPLLPLSTSTDGSGNATTTWEIPNEPIAIGLNLYSQYLCLDPFLSTPLQATTSNRNTILIGGWL